MENLEKTLLHQQALKGEHMFITNACPVDCPFVKHTIVMATDQTAFISFFLLGCAY